MISDFGAPFYFIGDFDMGIKNIDRIEKFLVNENNNAYRGMLDGSKHVREVYLKLKIDNEKAQNLMGLVENIIIKNKVRILGAFISTPEDEILIDLGVNTSVDNIIKLNSDLFEQAYDNDLMGELNALSINFTPINMEELKYAIF